MRFARIALSLSLLVSLITPISLQATFEMPSLPTLDQAKEKAYTAAKISPILFLAYSIGALFWYEPKPDRKPQYNLEKIWDVNLAQNDTNAYLANLKALYWDGFVGQHFKDSHMTVKPDGTIKQSRKCYPFGFLGWLFTYTKVHKKTTELLLALSSAKIAFGGDIKKLYKWLGWTQDEDKKDDKSAAPGFIIDEALLTQIVDRKVEQKVKAFLAEQA